MTYSPPSPVGSRVPRGRAGRAGAPHDGTEVKEYGIMVAVTEKRTKEEIDALVAGIRRVSQMF